MPRVLIADKLEAAGVELLQESGLEVDNKPGLKPEELKAICGSTTRWSSASAAKITADMLASPGKWATAARRGRR